VNLFPVYPALDFSDLFTFSSIAGYRSLSDFKTTIPGKCQFCNFKVRNLSPDSTPRDLVLLTMMNKAINVVPFVRTLRTSGSRATVVIFTDVVAMRKLDTNLTLFLEGCGCTVICVERIALTLDSHFYLRHFVFYDFLRTRYQLFDRVVTLDLYDTIFQGDPFFSGFNRDAIGFVGDVSLIEGQQLESILMLLTEEFREELHRHHNINMGLSTAEAAMYVKFLHFYGSEILARPIDLLGGLLFTDQDLLNALVWSNATKKAGIRVELYGSNDAFHCAWQRCDRGKVTRKIGEYRMSKGAPYPLVVHQVDRCEPLLESVVRACPPEFPTEDEYVRDFEILIESAVVWPHRRHVV
jgi:hypothetical protein